MFWVADNIEEGTGVGFDPMDAGNPGQERRKVEKTASTITGSCPTMLRSFGA
jgi:hypothetical protein